MTHPFVVPSQLSPDLARVQAYWRGLLRGAAAMPFWDDAKLADLPDLADHMLLIDAFERPERFRLNIVGKALDMSDVAGKFIDEAALGWPFAYLRAQCSATVESAAPTCFRQEASAAGAPAYTRLILPMWGDGRVSMLLGVVDVG